jgi:hypothetical protein
MKLTCCLCNLEVEFGEADTYTIQVSKPAGMGLQKKPELMWAHGPCLARQFHWWARKFQTEIHLGLLS